MHSLGKLSQSHLSPFAKLSALLVLFVLGGMPSSYAQGNYQKLPGVKNPPAWQDTAYNPPVMDGAMHLRIGRSGVSGFAGIGRDQRLTGTTAGEPTCDYNYLFHAKANTLPDPVEVSICAAHEEKIRVVGGGAPRDMTNSFVKAEVEKEWEAWMKKRIQTMKGYKRFYFRPQSFFLKPYDMARQAFDVDINFEQIKGSYYKPTFFVERSMDTTGKMFQTRIAPDQAFARKLEWSRANSLIDSGMFYVHFDVDGVELVKTQNLGEVRGFAISKVSWNLAFFTEDGMRLEIEISG